MRRVAPRRRDHGGLLTRRPQLDAFPDRTGEDSYGIDWVDQLRRLVDLYDRGLVSREQLRSQQERIIRLD
jgi:hypothetical protein